MPMANLWFILLLVLREGSLHLVEGEFLFRDSFDFLLHELSTAFPTLTH